LGYQNNFVIYDESEQLGVIKKILSHISAKGEKTDPRLVLGLLSRIKNANPDTPFIGNPNVAVLAEHVKDRYERALKACNAVDFDDLIILTLRLLTDHPDVLQACRDHYRYVMVDEYQDTNAAQFRLVNLLTQEHRNLCVVGDDDQSIYGWRGAEISNLLDMEKYYPEVKVIKLEQNYRSTNTILDAANAVIKHNVRRRGKKLWSANGEGDKILLHTFENEEEEAQTIVESIEYNRMAHKTSWSEQAILFRTNQQARPLETALRKAGVRYNLVGGQSFFDRREIRDFLAYLKMMVNPHDDNSLLRIANVPARGLSELTMERLLGASHERKCSVYTVMRHTDVLDGFLSKTKESILDFVHFIDETRQPLLSRAPLSLQTWADHFLGQAGYWDELRRSEKNIEVAENRIRNLKELAANLDQGDAQNPIDRLIQYLEEISLDQDRQEEKEVEGDFVTLITMHSCKGLEYGHVFIVGLEDGLLPHTRSKEEGTLDEERRLFYVGITRAKKSLNLSYCVARKKYGQPMPCHPSPFLKELPPELVEDANERTNQPVTATSSKSLFDVMRSAIQ
jgi:superfamily I DNA/RNA helicase